MESFHSQIDSTEKPKNQKFCEYHPEIQEYRELAKGTREKIDGCRTQIIAEKIGKDLQNRFSGQKISFDIKKFQTHLELKIGDVLSNSSIPEIAKEKFLRDIESKFEKLSTVTPQDIENLRTRRNVESFGVESWELSQTYGDDEGKKQAYYLQKILDSTIDAYVSGASLGLEKAFGMQKETIGMTEYNRENTQELFSNLKQLDEKYGLQITEIVQKIGEKENLSQAQLYRRCGIIIAEKLGRGNKVPDTSRVLELIKNGVLNTRAKSFLTEYDKDGKKEDIVDAVLAYKDIFSKFQGKENEAKGAKETALSDGFVSQAKDFIGMERLESDFTYTEPSNIEDKIKKLNISDTVIMLTQLVQISPIIGDIGGGIDGLYSAYSGINVQGEKLSVLERTINTIFGILGVTIVGGFIAKALKAKQFGKVMMTLKKILPELKANIEKIVPSLPKELLEKISPLFLALGITLSPQVVSATTKFATEVKDTSHIPGKPKFAKAENWRTKEGNIPENIISNARLSDNKTDMVKIGEQTISVSPRMAKLYNEVKGFDEVKNMSPKEIEQMLEAIQSGHMKHNEISVGQHTQRQIIDKWKEAKNQGAPDTVIRHALENGYMGTALSVQDIEKVTTGFNFRGISEGVAQSIKSQIADFIHISKNLDLEENQTRLLSIISDGSDVSLRNLLIGKESRKIGGEIEFPKEFLDSVDNIITYFKKNTSLHTVDISVLERFKNQIQDGFYSADIFANDFYEVLDTIRKGFSKKPEKVLLRSERLTAEVGLDITRFPDFDKIMPPELVKAMNNLVDIYKQKGSTMTLADIPQDVKTALSFFSSGGGLLRFIQTHGGGDLRVLSVRINPTEVIKNMYIHLTNLQVEGGIIQRGDFNEKLLVSNFQQLVKNFSFMAGK